MRCPTNLECARELFVQMPGRNVVSWNVMIGGFLKGLSPELGLELSLKGNNKAMVSVVKPCRRLRKLNGGKLLHA